MSVPKRDDPAQGRPFTMPETYSRVPGLQDTVERLHSETRYRSALDEIFRVLEHDRRNPHALVLATIILSASRTTQLEGEEPLTEDYYSHPCLDPLACTCANCGTHWFSNHFMIGGQFTTISTMDPIGAQCQQCRHTLCRECNSKLHTAQRSVEITVLDKVCEKCGGEFGAPVLPTGRDPAWHEALESGGAIEQLLVFREGPITPGAEYLEQLMELFPRFFPEKVGISVYAAPHGDLVGLAEAMVVELAGRGEVAPGSLERTTFAQGVDHNDTKFLIAAVAGAKPDDVAVQVQPEDRRRLTDRLRGWLRRRP